MAIEYNEIIPVSVVIPVFNDQSGLIRCLESIAKQTYSMNAIEVIVVDNGSTPALSITDKYPFSLELVQCATPGSYAARNMGVRVSTGKLIAFTDADCWPAPNWLAEGVRTVVVGEDKAIVGGEVSIIRPKTPSAVALYQWATGFGQETNVREKFFSATANLLCTAAQFQAVGPFDERLLSGGDREWCWRAVRLGMRLQYAPGFLIYTEPRTHLRDAMRQARRVVSGRRELRTLKLTHMGETALSKYRSSSQAVAWILCNSDLGPGDRFRVLCVAGLIRIAALFETIRLSCGADAERR